MKTERNNEKWRLPSYCFHSAKEESERKMLLKELLGNAILRLFKGKEKKEDGGRTRINVSFRRWTSVWLRARTGERGGGVARCFLIWSDPPSRKIKVSFEAAFQKFVPRPPIISPLIWVAAKLRSILENYRTPWSMKALATYGPRRYVSENNKLLSKA